MKDSDRLRCSLDQHDDDLISGHPLGLTISICKKCKRIEDQNGNEVVCSLDWRGRPDRVEAYINIDGEREYWDYRVNLWVLTKPKNWKHRDFGEKDNRPITLRKK